MSVARVRRWWAALSAALVLAGCQAEPAEGGGEPVTVLAASSLKEPFDALAQAWSASPSGSKVEVVYGGSQALRLQIEGGARADVFASANAEHVAPLREGGRVAWDEIFASNVLVIVTPPDDPAKIGAARELPKARRVVLGAERVPVGAYTERFLANMEEAEPGFGARVRARVVSRETNVRLVLTRVVLGEADAGVVYATDAKAAGDKVRVVPIEAAQNVTARYRLAVLNGAPQAERGEAFARFVLAPEGQAILAEHGFGPPGVEDAAP